MMEEHCASIVSLLVINAKHDIDKINVKFAEKICTFEYNTYLKHVCGFFVAEGAMIMILLLLQL